jgi:hypothetical protein
MKWPIYDSRLERSGLVGRVPYMLGQVSRARGVGRCAAQTGYYRHVPPK